MGYLCARERRLPSNTQLLRLHEKRRGTPIPQAYERGRVMSNYVAEYDIDDFADNCECCAMNLEILEGESK